MKNTFGVLTLAILAAGGLSSFSFPQDKQESQSKKTRHIRLVKMEDGKKMELDTVVPADEVFVWNGDTINPVRHIKGFSPSEFDQMHNPDGWQDRRDKMRMLERRIDQLGQENLMHMDSDKMVQIFTEEENDSTGKKIIIHQRLNNGNMEDRIIHLKGHNGNHFPPVPPMPPMSRMRMFEGNRNKGTIDLNDPNIISFKKKKMSGDREKIEIIRKKSEADENMNFDFHMNDAMGVPEPPEPPEFDFEFDFEESTGERVREAIIEEEKNEFIRSEN